MKRFSFISLAVLGLYGVAEDAQGMFHFLNNREKLEEKTSRECIYGEPVHQENPEEANGFIKDLVKKIQDETNRLSECCNKDEYQSVAISYEDQVVSMIRQSGDLIREIKKLYEENLKLKREWLNQNLKLDQDLVHNVSSSKFNALETLTNVYSNTLASLTNDVAELSEKLENLKKENEALKREKSSASTGGK